MRRTRSAAYAYAVWARPVMRSETSHSFFAFDLLTAQKGASARSQSAKYRPETPTSSDVARYTLVIAPFSGVCNGWFSQLIQRCRSMRAGSKLTDFLLDDLLWFDKFVHKVDEFGE